ncbi:MAG: VOC family protein, partial [Pseudohongiellaceae bacterium]
MANKHGEFIWYELMTRDPDAAKAFYDDVVGWTVGEPPPGGDMDYRMIAAGDGYAGGVLGLTDDMCEHGARPVWLGYIGVDDVDATAAKLREIGGSVLMPAKDIPNVGRIAMVADPQGVPFYIMRGAVEGGTSFAFKPMADGHCSWNELTTTNQDGAVSFYGQLFGWESNEAMPMGEPGDYRFLDHHGIRIGAVMPRMSDSDSPIWTYYFHVPDINAATAKTEARGGKVLSGPHEVPGGEHIMVGADPEGVMFALVGPIDGV